VALPGEAVSEGIFSLFLSANTHSFFHGKHENLPIPDLACFGAFDNRDDYIVGSGIRNDNFNFNFGKKINGIFAAAINFGVALLATEAFDLGNSHSLNANVTQAVFYFLQLEWFDDGLDFSHMFQFGVGEQMGKPVQAFAATSFGAAVSIGLR
jgi:hypothetical protein